MLDYDIAIERSKVKDIIPLILKTIMTNAIYLEKTSLIQPFAPVIILIKHFFPVMSL